jgi:hypothetical protein
MENIIGLTKRSASTIAEAVNIALEHIPMTFANSDIAPGRKVFFAIPMKKTAKDMTDFIYVYAESKLPKPPHDLRFGFTETDVVDETGVYLFKKDGNIISGSTYSVEAFLDSVTDDLLWRNRLMDRMNEMRRIVHLDDGFLDIANHEWDAHKDIHDFGIQRLN